MKSLRMLSVMALTVCGWITSYGQGSDAEVPGDHFSLEGALELFKKSESPEHFEKLLNSPDSKVNNLDLNGDGYIDYIRVFDRYEGNVHVFIMQAVISDSENQDIAVIELEKLDNGKAVLQIVGNEDIYGVETIIEPTREVRTYAGTTTTSTVVNVWSWPVVHYVYSPYYTAWHSPWGWHHRAVWWRPWRPVVYVHYYDYWSPYYAYYAPCHSRRIVYAHTIYRPYRTTSIIVRDRHYAQVTRYRSHHSNGSDGNNGGRISRGSTRGADREQQEGLTNSGRSSANRDVTNVPNQSSSRQRTNPNIERNAVVEQKTQERTWNARSSTRQQTSANTRSSSEPVRQRTVARQRTTPDQSNVNTVTRSNTQNSNVRSNTRQQVRQQPQVRTQSVPSQNMRQSQAPAQRSTTMQRSSSSGNSNPRQRGGQRVRIGSR